MFSSFLFFLQPVDCVPTKFQAHPRTRLNLKRLSLTSPAVQWPHQVQRAVSKAGDTLRFFSLFFFSFGSLRQKIIMRETWWYLWMSGWPLSWSCDQREPAINCDSVRNLGCRSHSVTAAASRDGEQTEMTLMTFHSRSALDVDSRLPFSLRFRRAICRTHIRPKFISSASCSVACCELVRLLKLLSVSPA